MFNPSVQATFGYSAEEAIGSGIERFIPRRLHEVHRHHADRFVNCTILSGRNSATNMRPGRTAREAKPRGTSRRCNLPFGPVEQRVNQFPRLFRCDEAQVFVVIAQCDRVRVEHRQLVRGTRRGDTLRVKFGG